MTTVEDKTFSLNPHCTRLIKEIRVMNDINPDVMRIMNILALSRNPRLDPVKNKYELLSLDIEKFTISSDEFKALYEEVNRGVQNMKMIKEHGTARAVRIADSGSEIRFTGYNTFHGVNIVDDCMNEHLKELRKALLLNYRQHLIKLAEDSHK